MSKHKHLSQSIQRDEILKTIRNDLSILYGKRKGGYAFDKTRRLLTNFGVKKKKKRMSEKDIVLITYGDSLQNDKKPLKILNEFLNKYLKGTINTVHILPFFPYSSDRGFSVIDYREVNLLLGDWDDIKKIHENFNLMFGEVINHISSQSEWFKEFLRANPKYRDYFISFESEDAISTDDLGKITRSRTSPLLTRFKTKDGYRYVWTTFGSDQIDLNYHNPDVLIEAIDLLLFYIDKGVDIVRLDAVAYIWKELGTNCVNRRQVHIILKIFRVILKLVAPYVMLLCEVNLPQRQNLSYFGRGDDESHIIYDYTLPPLLLFTFYKGNVKKLSRWASHLRIRSNLDFIFNFLDSHDGIGLSPVEGILTEREIESMINTVKKKGGLVSYRRKDGREIPYELNTTWFSAIKDDDEELSIRKYLCSIAVALSMEGIPGIYIQSLFGMENDLKKVSRTGIKRDINRSELDIAKIIEALEDKDSKENRVFTQVTNLIGIRTKQQPFHPAARQDILYLNDSVFSILRASGTKEILALHNVSDNVQKIDGKALKMGKGFDLIGEKEISVEIILEPYQFMWVKSSY
jgi:sucrose phosphorylase